MAGFGWKQQSQRTEIAPKLVHTNMGWRGSKTFPAAHYARGGVVPNQYQGNQMFDQGAIGFPVPPGSLGQGTSGGLMTGGGPTEFGNADTQGPPVGMEQQGNNQWDWQGPGAEQAGIVPPAITPPGMKPPPRFLGPPVTAPPAGVPTGVGANPWQALHGYQRMLRG